METHNLIAVASYPLEFNWQNDTPLPFRDSIQTAVYAAARHALNPNKDHQDNDWRGRPRLFEIGKRGPIELGTANKPIPLMKTPHLRRVPIVLLAFCSMVLLLRYAMPKTESVWSGSFRELGKCWKPHDHRGAGSDHH